MEPLSLIESVDQLDDILEDDAILFVLKHSTSCPISAEAKQAFDAFAIKHEDNKDIRLFQINVIEHREVSNKVAALFGILHESPQLLVIKNKKVLFETSHWDITLENLEKQLP